VLADDVDAASPLPTLPRSLSRLPTERGLLCRLRRTSTGEPWDCSGADDSIGDTPLRDATAATATAGSALASLSSPESLAVGDTHATPCQKNHMSACVREGYTARSEKERDNRQTHDAVDDSDTADERRLAMQRSNAPAVITLHRTPRLVRDGESGSDLLAFFLPSITVTHTHTARTHRTMPRLR
jgi:hypothetical protein